MIEGDGRRIAWAKAEAWLAARARNVPRVSYPPELPITPRADEIVAALRSPRRRVVIISGETGCGKSTQIPKMCLEAGRGVAGRIGVTQPRRLAAMTIAAPHRRGARGAAREVGRLQDPLPGPDLARRLHQGHDRRHPAGRDPGRPRSPRVRHDHHRRGPRALAQHRLPARHHAAPARRAPRPQAGHHLGHARHGEVLQGLQERADHRGQRPPLPGRGRIPGAGQGGGRGQGLRRPGRRGGRVSEARQAARRRPRLHADRAGHPRDLPHARRAEVAGGQGAAALLAPAGGPAAARLHRDRTQDRRGHERRRDLADHPRHPLRRGHGGGEDRPVSAGNAHQQPAHLAGLAGLGRPAQGPVRPRQRGPVRAALQPGRLRVARRVHPARDPAVGPGRGHPAHDRPGPGRPAPVPVHRPARVQGRPRRLRYAGRAGRCQEIGAPAPARRFPLGADRDGPGHGPHAGRSAPVAHADRGPGRELRPRGVRARGGAEHPRPARAAPGQGPAGRCRARRVQASRFRLPRSAQHLEPLSRRLREARLARPEAALLPRELPVLPAHAGVGLSARRDRRGAAGSWPSGGMAGGRERPEGIKAQIGKKQAI